MNNNRVNKDISAYHFESVLNTGIVGCTVVAIFFLLIPTFTL